MITCSELPKIIGEVKLCPTEFMYYMYLPISLKDSLEVKLPPNLYFLHSLIDHVLGDTTDLLRRNVYITAKTMYVDAQSPGNRPGWHMDGFQSDGDINYIWYDNNPTQFTHQLFKNIPDDDALSMYELENQAEEKFIETYPCNVILRLNERVVHRVNPDARACFRTFIKITISDHMFNAFGNSKNYLLDYDWPVEFRKTTVRNLDHGNR